MRYPASEKLAVIKIVEQSHLLAKRARDILGIPRTESYGWYNPYQADGPEALENKPSRPSRVWKSIPDEIRHKTVRLALDRPEWSPKS